MKIINVHFLLIVLCCNVNLFAGNTLVEKNSGLGVQNNSAIRIVVINPMVVFQQSIDGKRIHNELVAGQQRLRSEFDSYSQQIEKAYAEYTKKTSTMSEEARRKEEKRIAQLDRDLRAKSDEQKEEFELMAASKQEAWYKNFLDTIAEWAQQNNYSLVLDEVTGRVLYADDMLKETDALLAFVDSSNNTHTKMIVGQKSKDAPANNQVKQ